MSDLMHIYRTSDKRVLDAWDDTQREMDEHRERCSRAIVSWGFGLDIELFKSRSAFGGTRWIGIAWPSDRETPQYWRRDRDTPGMIVPRMASAAGKRIGKELTSLAVVPSLRAKLSDLGMPDIVIRGSDHGIYAYTSTGIRHDDVVWVKWMIDPNPVEEDERHGRVDPDIWEQVPLSEYFALVENGHDPFYSDNDEHE